MNAQQEYQRRVMRRLAIHLAWAILISTWVVRGYFVHENGTIHLTTEGYHYVYRQVAFNDILSAGSYSPQWCSNFRGGLGAPYFSYYQPGFFYVASLFRGVDTVVSMGIALWIFSLIGYGGIAYYLRRDFGDCAALAAGSLFILSVYASTELYVRGDLSEYSAMMVFAAAMASLMIWLQDRRVAALACYIGFSAFLVALHPCIALPGHVCLGLIATISFLLRKSVRRVALGALAAQALAVGLASFYWMPVLTELHWVRADQAVDGFYHYTNHFLLPKWFIEPYSRDATIPYTMGQPLAIALFLGCVTVSMRWGMLTTRQRYLTAVLAGVLWSSFMLMTSVSEFIWAMLTPLQRLQFPWRLYTLFTFSAAGLGSLTVLMVSSKFRRLATLLIVGTAITASWTYTQRDRDLKFQPIRDSSELADSFYFAPDLADEWFPVDASRHFEHGSTADRAPSATSGIEISDFERAESMLRCYVNACVDGHIVLPHYYFPGWLAELNGQQREISADDDGLISVRVKQNDIGPIELRFTTTPARRIGWYISITSLCVALAGLGLLSHRLAHWVNNDPGSQLKVPAD